MQRRIKDRPNLHTQASHGGGATPYIVHGPDQMSVPSKVAKLYLCHFVFFTLVDVNKCMIDFSNEQLISFFKEYVFKHFRDEGNPADFVIPIARLG